MEIRIFTHENKGVNPHSMRKFQGKFDAKFMKLGKLSDNLVHGVYGVIAKFRVEKSGGIFKIYHESQIYIQCHSKNKRNQVSQEYFEKR